MDDVTRLLTKIHATQNEVELDYHRVRRLYFMAVIFTAAIFKFLDINFLLFSIFHFSLYYR